MEIEQCQNPLHAEHLPISMVEGDAFKAEKKIVREEEKQGKEQKNSMDSREEAETVFRRDIKRHEIPERKSVTDTMIQTKI